MQFIVPGLIMMSVITDSYANFAWSFFSSKFKCNIEELLIVAWRVVFALACWSLLSRCFLPPHVYAWVGYSTDTATNNDSAVLVSGVEQYGVRRHFWRHQPNFDLRTDAADLSGRNILFANAAAANLAGSSVSNVSWIFNTVVLIEFIVVFYLLSQYLIERSCSPAQLIVVRLWGYLLWSVANLNNLIECLK